MGHFVPNIVNSFGLKSSMVDLRLFDDDGRPGTGLDWCSLSDDYLLSYKKYCHKYAVSHVLVTHLNTNRSSQNRCFA